MSHAPPHLTRVVADLVHRAVDAASRDLPAAEVVADLVNASRWNPALLMVAAEQVGELACRSSCTERALAIEHIRGRRAAGPAPGVLTGPARGPALRTQLAAPRRPS